MLRWRGAVAGPYSLSAIEQKLDDQEIGMLHEIQRDGHWMTLGEFFIDLKARPKTEATVARANPRVVVAVAPAGPSVASPPLCESSSALPPRRQVVFAALGLLFGFAGAHNFYARRWPVGAAQLAAMGVTWYLGAGIIATWIWALIEVVFVQSDGKGVRLA